MVGPSCLYHGNSYIVKMVSLHWNVADFSISLKHCLMAVTWLLWQYTHSQISMAFAHGLAPTWSQDICNHLDNITQSLCIRSTQHNDTLCTSLLVQCLSYYFILALLLHCTSAYSNFIISHQHATTSYPWFNATDRTLLLQTYQSYASFVSGHRYDRLDYVIPLELCNVGIWACFQYKDSLSRYGDSHLETILGMCSGNGWWHNIVT